MLLHRNSPWKRLGSFWSVWFFSAIKLFLNQKNSGVPKLFCVVKYQRNGFQCGGAMEHWQVLSATMVGRPEKFFNSRHSRMVKTVTFSPWWQPFSSFYLQSLSFFSLFPSFSFYYEKKGRGGEHRPPDLPVSPALFSRSLNVVLVLKNF